MMNDASEVFSLDFTEDVKSTAAPVTDNAFVGLEQHLKLPLGSTNEGLKAAKAEAKAIAERTKAVVAANKSMSAKEKANERLPVPMFTQEMLDADRARIRQEANEVYDIAREFLNQLQNQLADTIMPTERQWTAAATMITSVTSALEKLNALTTQFRQEEEVKAFKIDQEAAANGNVQEFDFTPQDMNKLIEQWSEELDEKVAKQIEDESEARNRGQADILAQQIANQPKP